jgi:hypothetical protein
MKKIYGEKISRNIDLCGLQNLVKWSGREKRRKKTVALPKKKSVALPHEKK